MSGDRTLAALALVCALLHGPDEQLLDDALFNLWKNGLCEEEDVVLRSNQPGEFKARITRAKKGLLDDEPEGEEEEGEEDEE